jgi:hypothetical protein
MAMMAMTTSSSMRVKAGLNGAAPPERRHGFKFDICLPIVFVLRCCIKCLCLKKERGWKRKPAHVFPKLTEPAGVVKNFGWRGFKLEFVVTLAFGVGVPLVWRELFKPGNSQ